MTAHERVQLPWAEALVVKWEQGREAHRGDSPGWVGEDPLLELYDELLDAENYLSVYLKQKTELPFNYRWLADIEEREIEGKRRVIRDLALWVRRQYLMSTSCE